MSVPVPREARRRESEGAGPYRTCGPPAGDDPERAGIAAVDSVNAYRELAEHVDVLVAHEAQLAVRVADRAAVSGLSRILPATDLRRVRLAALLGGCLMAVALFTQQAGSFHGALWNGLGRVATILYMIALTVVFAGDRIRWWHLPVLPALIAFSASGVVDPLAVVAMAATCSMALSLYGDTRVWLLSMLGTTTTVPVAIALTPVSLGRAMVWHDATILGLLPSVAIAGVMMRGIHAALLRLQRSAARDAVVARTGTAVLTATDLEQVYSLGQRAAAEVADIHPGLAWLGLRRRSGELQVWATAGLAGQPLDRIVPDEVIADPARLSRIVPGPRHWRVVSLPDDAYIAVGGPRPVPDDVVDTFQALASQVVLGGRMIESWATLDHRANHDQLTRLANRSRFFDRLTEAIDQHPPGTVALINIDLDDFKTVNDTFGHSAGDALLVEVAARLREVDVPGLPARFGGDEFAVLLTGITGPAEAESIALRLRDALIRPVHLTNTRVTVGASIGVALTEAGETVAELSRRADLAMYAAKACGKSQVRIFDHATVRTAGIVPGGDHRLPA